MLEKKKTEKKEIEKIESDLNNKIENFTDFCGTINFLIENSNLKNCKKGNGVFLTSESLKISLSDSQSISKNIGIGKALNSLKKSITSDLAKVSAFDKENSKYRLEKFFEIFQENEKLQNLSNKQKIVILFFVMSQKVFKGEFQIENFKIARNSENSTNLNLINFEV